MSLAVHTRSFHAQPRTSPIAGAIAGDFPLDTNVINSFPPGTKVLSAYKFAKSRWTLTARLDLVLLDGTAASYFLKCAAADAGRIMMEGEFQSMSTIYQTTPGLVPRPHSWGKFSTSPPEMYSFLVEFIDLSDRMPEPNQLCSQLAKLHMLNESPTGKFGFQVTTCQGRVPQAVRWESNWTIYFGNLLRHVITMDDAENGPWSALTQLEERLLSRVVPRLLDNLTKDGRVVKPCLVHGDLWEGNTGICRSTGKVYLFDAAAMYAHNEFEIGNWRCYYNKIHREIYTQTYLRHYGPSEPRDEWDDRNRLYCIYYNVLYSVNHRGDGEAVRQQ
jgi:fructosamine-3-kinase